MKHTRRGPLKVHVKPKPRRITNVEKQLDEYNIRLKQKIAVDKVKVQELKLEVQKLIENKLPIFYPTYYETSNTDDHTLTNETLVPMRRWMKRYPEITWTNMIPFTETGDINDAIFRLPEDIRDDPLKFLRPWLKNYRAFDCGVFISDPTSKSKRAESTIVIPNKCYNEPQFLKGKVYKQDEAIIYYQNLIKRIWHFDTSIPKGTYVWRPIQSYIGTATWTDAELMKRKQLDTDLNLMVERRQRLSLYFQADIGHFCRFAEKMRTNIIELEDACKNELKQKK